MRKRNHAYIPEFPGELADSPDTLENPAALSVLCMSHRVYWKLVRQIAKILNPALKSLTVPVIQQMLQTYPGVKPTFAWGHSPLEFQVMITSVEVTTMRAYVTFELCKFWEISRSAPNDGTYFAYEMLDQMVSSVSQKKRKYLEDILKVEHGGITGRVVSETTLLVIRDTKKGVFTSVVEPGFELEPVVSGRKTRISFKNHGKRLSASEAVRTSGLLFDSHADEPLGLPKPYRFLR